MLGPLLLGALRSSGLGEGMWVAAMKSVPLNSWCYHLISVKVIHCSQPFLLPSKLTFLLEAGLLGLGWHVTTLSFGFSGEDRGL